MKKFKDLEFKAHQNAPYFSTQATIYFKNGYGVRVVTGQHAYSSESSPYEVAVLKADDVIGYCDEKKVTEIMEQVQSL